MALRTPRLFNDATPIRISKFASSTRLVHFYSFYGHFIPFVRCPLHKFAYDAVAKVLVYMLLLYSVLRWQQAAIFVEPKEVVRQRRYENNIGTPVITQAAPARR